MGQADVTLRLWIIPSARSMIWTIRSVRFGVERRQSAIGKWSRVSGPASGRLGPERLSTEQLTLQFHPYTEFTSMAVLRWSQDRQIDWHYIARG